MMWDYISSDCLKTSVYGCLSVLTKRISPSLSMGAGGETTQNVLLYVAEVAAVCIVLGNYLLALWGERYPSWYDNGAKG